jgi:sugar phosphate permease
VEGPLIGVIVDYYGWSGAFYFMVILSILASLSLLRASRVDATSS